jgi:protein SCO1/2
MNRTAILTALAVLAATAALALVFFFSRPAEPSRPLPKELVSIVLPEARALEPFQLTDIEQKPFDRERLKGKWSLLFFGYTHCPDICPTTLTSLRLMARQLQQTPDYYQDLQVVFISVDPGRDSLPHLKEYVSYFHPDFLAATGKKTQIDKLARQLGAVYMFDGDTNTDDYIVNHSASIALIDPQGRWVARFNPPHKASKMADDFRRLRDYYQQ